MTTITAPAVAIVMAAPAAAEDVQAQIDRIVASHLLAWKCQGRPPTGTTYTLTIEGIGGFPSHSDDVYRSMVEAANRKAKAELKHLDQSAACRLAQERNDPITRDLLRKKP